MAAFDSDAYRVTRGRGFELPEHDPGDTGPFSDKEEARKPFEKARERMRALQQRLYADDRFALLLVFQAMDAAGKDGTIEHVLGGLNPAGCQVFSFKTPSAEELDHDFLWRTTRCLPERGRIGVFNRSYYEEVLVVRVHPEYLAAQRLPDRPLEKLWRQRYSDIVTHERHLARSGTVVRKFFLNVSREEQRERFLARLDEPEKNWKFSLGDVKERARWADYQQAYEAAIAATATPWAPWYVVPADHKWFARLVVADAIVRALGGLDLRYPVGSPEREKDLAEARRLLEEDSDRAAPPPA